MSAPSPIEQAARVADLALALGAIRLCVARWASYDKAERDRQGLSTPPDTHIVAPPVWPTHGQLAAWVDHLDRAEEALSDAGMLVGGEAVAALAVSADFEPQDTPDGFVEWTFAVRNSVPFGAGLYEIRHVRYLAEGERDNPHHALPAAPQSTGGGDA